MRLLILDREERRLEKRRKNGERLKMPVGEGDDETEILHVLRSLYVHTVVIVSDGGCEMLNMCICSWLFLVISSASCTMLIGGLLAICELCAA